MPSPNGFLLLSVLECVLICPLHFRVDQVLIVPVLQLAIQKSLGTFIVPILLYHILWIYPTFQYYNV